MRQPKMRRLQIYLDPSMDAQLRRLSAKTGKSKAELVRNGVKLLLKQEAAQTKDALLELVGIAGKAGYPDAAERHDEYLYGKEVRSEDSEE